MRLALALVISGTLCACSSLNQVQYHRIEANIPTNADLDSKNPVFFTEGVCVMVSESTNSMDVKMISFGPGIFPLILPIIPVGLPSSDWRHANYIQIDIQFYSPGQINRELAFDPSKVTLEYDDGTLLTPRVVGYLRGVVSSARHQGQSFFERPEHLVQVSSTHATPIEEISIPVPLLAWSKFHLVFPEVNMHANAAKLKINGLTRNKQEIVMPLLLFRAVSEIQYIDEMRGLRRPILMPTSSAFAPCQSQF